ncbi:unnamed protein product [Rhizoctonia solani]|uniref:Uncharacterized protein n=1 Tax=Rhizoctonia solani TaxID=456999 RepID=A0A8H2ZW37_9AGAM|nr:unnamed protein product [Rhizoctonia solani]
MLGFKLLTFLVACIMLVVAFPTPTHKHKDSDRNFFWWSRKGTCLPYGGTRGVIIPPSYHCGRWYWHKSLGYYVPPQPDWSDPQCPARWRWDEGAYSCLPSTPALPGPGGVAIGHCGPSYFWWGLKSLWLLIGGLFLLFRMAGSVRITGTGTAADIAFLVKLGTVRTLYARPVTSGTPGRCVANRATRMMEQLYHAKACF